MVVMAETEAAEADSEAADTQAEQQAPEPDGAAEDAVRADEAMESATAGQEPFGQAVAVTGETSQATAEDTAGAQTEMDSNEQAGEREDEAAPGSHTKTEE